MWHRWVQHLVVTLPHDDKNIAKTIHEFCTDTTEVLRHWLQQGLIQALVDLCRGELTTVPPELRMLLPCDKRDSMVAINEIVEVSTNLLVKIIEFIENPSISPDDDCTELEFELTDEEEQDRAHTATVLAEALYESCVWEILPKSGAATVCPGVYNVAAAVLSLGYALQEGSEGTAAVPVELKQCITNFASYVECTAHRLKRDKTETSNAEKFTLLAFIHGALSIGQDELDSAIIEHHILSIVTYSGIEWGDSDMLRNSAASIMIVALQRGNNQLWKSLVEGDNGLVRQLLNKDLNNVGQRLIGVTIWGIMLEVLSESSELREACQEQAGWADFVATVLTPYQTACDDSRLKFDEAHMKVYGTTPEEAQSQFRDSFDAGPHGYPLVMQIAPPGSTTPR